VRSPDRHGGRTPGWSLARGQCDRGDRLARQGIGQLAIEAILQKDYPLVQGIILLTASTYVVVNLLVDLSYGYLDPQIRTAS
jgi:hypothetical protein